MGSTNSDTIFGTVPPEPIAIIGMGCRFPGDSDSPAEFWQMLLEKRSGRCSPPLSRYNIEGFGSEKIRPGKLRPKGGYFINEDVWSFDPSFFGIVPAEASAMDPQQRKLLECVYEAFESGGITLAEVSGSNTGCYVGNFTYDYYLQAHRDHDNPKDYAMLGGGNTILSNRISYLYNLRGPSFTLDSACSSSLYALHLACRALASGEVEGAIVGGANLLLAPEVQMATDQMGVLSGTSTCHTFDSAADGYGRAEGIGALYLKRLSDAIRGRDPIRGVVRGTAANANGKTSGITQPSSSGQEAVIRAAYKYACLEFNDTSYFETHGTGTPVGDPIEMRGIAKVFLEDPSRRSLLVGAVKTNVGHGEASSAMASLIKMVLALEAKRIPATIGIKEFNPKINFHDGKIQVVQNLIPWPEEYPIHRASINSFGYGGANAHAILEASSTAVPNLATFAQRREGKESVPTKNESQEMIGIGDCRMPVLEREEFLLLFSAHDLPTLKNNIARYRAVAEDYNISDLAYTLGCRRSAFFNCAYVVVREDEIEDDLMEHEITFAKRGKGANLAFIFTGQGAQSAQMGLELMLNFPSYIDTVRRLDNALKSLGSDAPSWTLEDVLMEPASTSMVNDPELSQPVCTAVQIAIVELLGKWNINAKACIGHSSGEIASAFASGALTAEEAIISAYYRGLAVGGLTITGTMLAVGASPDEIKPYLVDGVGIACYNSPNSVTLSGDSQAAEKVKQKLEKEKIFVRKLKTGGRAYHSHHMKCIGSEYEARLDGGLVTLMGTEGAASKAEFFSSVSGKRKLASFKPGAGYWRSNLESPVRFSDAVEAAIQTPDLEINHFIEIGPHSALAGPLRQIRDNLGISQKDLDYTPTLVRGQSSVVRLLDVAGVLTMKGYPVDMERVNSIERRVGDKIIAKKGLPIVDLPRYCWNYEGKNAYIRNDNRPNIEYRSRRFPHHDLLGSQIPGSSVTQRQWRNMLDAKRAPWLEEHKLGSQPVLPGTGYVAIAAEAARQFFQSKAPTSDAFRYFFPRVDILAALNIPAAGFEVEVLTTMRFVTISASITSKSIATFTISSCQNGIWTENCVGTVRKENASEMMPLFDEAELQEPKAARTWYKGFKKISLNYGPPFQGLADIRTDPAVQQAFAHTALLPTDISPDDSKYLVHPASMDTCIQVALIAAHRSSLKDLKRSFVPTTMEEVSLWAWEGENLSKLKPGKGKVLATADFHSLRAMRGSFQLFSPSDKPLFEIRNLSCTQYSEALGNMVHQDRHPYLRVLWKPDIDKLSRNLPVNSLLDLIAHKRPTMDILEITGTDSEYSELLHQTLESGSSLRRYNTYTVMSDSNEAFQRLTKYENTPGVTLQKINIENDELPGKQHDLIVISAIPEGDTRRIIDKIHALLKPMGRVLIPQRIGAGIAKHLELKGLHLLQQDDTFILLGAAYTVSPAKDIVLVTRGAPCSFESSIFVILSQSNRTVKSISLASKQLEVDPDAIYISTVESEINIFQGSLVEQELKNLQLISETARSILWITHGNLLAGGDPEAAIVIGLGRCLQTEHPTLMFRTLDLDHRDPKVTAAQISTIIDSLDDNNLSDDKEFIVKDGVFYVSRLSQDTALDMQYVEAANTDLTLKEYNPTTSARLRIERVGLLDTLYFEEDENEPIEDGQAEVEVKALGLNMKDYATLQGTYDSEMLNLEGSGIVRKVGKDVKNVMVGDRVAWVGPGLFKNIETYDARFLQKIGPDNSFESMATFLMPFVTAVYSLVHLAKLQKGETVLIHSATGGVGLAAVQISQWIGAEIFATVGGPEKREFLKTHYGLDNDHIFNSQDPSFVQGVMAATKGRGVNVSLNSLVREQLRATWNCIASHGRHIELGQTDILDQGSLDMMPFKRSASFIALDLALIMDERPEVMARILGEVMQLYRQGSIDFVPNLAIFPASEVSSAFKHFGEKDRIGKVVVSFNKTAKLMVAPKRKLTKYKSDGAYLLVGCLGGLGRCIARHMVDNGARNLVFLGRSGEDRPEAASMIKRFRSNGITVNVIKGDVTSERDVQKAVQSVHVPLLGIVQGVMALDDRLFSSHSISSWEYAVKPKVKGTWNLHNAVTGQPLDFFVMLGSTSAMTGVPTQSNYCAGNTFLEYFARYRHSLGLPATTISLTMVLEVGYVSQNEGIEEGLTRTGMAPLNEAEFIRLMDIAMNKAPRGDWNFDPLANNFLVTGLEPVNLASDLDLDGLPFWRQARTGPLLNALQDKNAGRDSEKRTGKNMSQLDFAGVLELVVEMFSKTFNLSFDDIDITTPIVAFGMDSMIGTSLRNWCYKQLGADIPSSEFMSTTLTAEILAKNIITLRKR